MKKRIKKILAIFMSYAVLITGGVLPQKNMIAAENAAAEHAKPPQIYSEDMTAEPGSEIEVPVKIDGNMGIMGFGFKVKFDEDVLTPVSVVKGELLEGTFDNNIGVYGNSNFDVMWSGTDEMSEDGILFKVVFKVSEYAKNGLTEINISYSGEDTFDEKYNDVTLDCSNINIIIEGEAKEKPTPTSKPADILNDPSMDAYTLYADYVECEKGELLSIPVMLQNNLGIMGLLMYVKYDAELLDPVSVVKGEVIPNGTTFDDNCMTSAGDTFKILWSGVDEITTNGCIFTLNFKVKENVKFSYSVIELSYKQDDTFDGDYMDVALNCKPIEIGRQDNPIETPEPTNPSITTEAPKVTEPPERTEPPKTTEPPKVTEPPEETEPPKITEPPKVTETPGETEPLETTEPPKVTEAPGETEPPETTEPPKVTETPGETEPPETTEPPKITESPETTELPKVTESPIVTDSPVLLQPPGITTQPGTTESPIADNAKPEKVKIKIAKSKNNKSIEVRWNKYKKIDGYQLQYALNKKFKQKKTKSLGAAKVSVILKKLKPGKNYYIRIRSYRFYRGKKIYSDWSKVKRCKVK